MVLFGAGDGIVMRSVQGTGHEKLTHDIIPTNRQLYEDALSWMPVKCRA
jgi:hypothetical protein